MPLEMPFEQIAWSEQMATGVPQVDAQHRFLIDTIRDANARLIDDHDHGLLEQVAKELLSYALMHFETEEELMKLYGYAESCPEAARAHIAQHRDFSRQVVTVCDHLREMRPVSPVDVLRYLNEWLRDHVLGVDQRLGAFVRAEQARQGTGQAG